MLVSARNACIENSCEAEQCSIALGDRVGLLNEASLNVSVNDRLSRKAKFGCLRILYIE